ncbi:MAG: redoxin domain-containing protein [Actinomycetota bacterium]
MPDSAKIDSSMIDKSRPLLVAFLCQHSPHVQHIAESFSEVARLNKHRLTIIGISSNDVRAYPADSEDQLLSQANRLGFEFPYCVDPFQRAAKAFQARCTPEFFIYNTQFRLVYHGRYDGTKTGSAQPATGNDLIQAIERVAGDKILEGDQYPSFGCSIKWTSGNEPLYSFSAAN